MCLLALVSSGKAAIPPAPAVTLQSVLSWIGDTLYSITNEGLYMLCSSHALHLLSLCRMKHQRNGTFSVFLQSGFRNHNSPWKFVLIGVQKRNGLQVASSISLAFTMKDKTNSRKRVFVWFLRCTVFFCLFAWSVNTESDTEDKSKHERPVLQCEFQTLPPLLSITQITSTILLDGHIKVVFISQPRISQFFEHYQYSYTDLGARKKRKLTYTRRHNWSCDSVRGWDFYTCWPLTSNTTRSRAI